MHVMRTKKTAHSLCCHHDIRTNQDSLAQCASGMKKLSWHTTARHHLPLSNSVLASRQL